MFQMIYRISGIHCIGCVNRIKSAFKDQGAQQVEFDIETQIAKVLLDEPLDGEKLKEQILKSGYQAEYLTTLEVE